jgi:gliding motility-associated lipoprotein GldH
VKIMQYKTAVILALLTLFGCDSKRVYEKNIDFSDKVWASRDIKTFTFDIPDIENGYNIYFNVRNTMDYPHYNLYISYQLKDSLNQIIHEELKNVNLFDPKTGAPFGQSSLGDIFNHQVLLLENFKFKNSGVKTLDLQQYMRYDSLREILSTGVRIEINSPD